MLLGSRYQEQWRALRYGTQRELRGLGTRSEMHSAKVAYGRTDACKSHELLGC